MKRLAIFAALALSGCGLTEKQRDEVDDIAYDSASDAISESKRISALEDRIEALENAPQTRAAFAPPKPAPQKDRTAELSLKAQLKQMSADGVCGQDPPTRLANGGVIIRNKTCTEADLH